MRIIPREHLSKPAIELMAMGYDTAEIAFSTGATEAGIYNEIGRQRGQVERHHRAPRASKYPLKSMAVGDFFSVPKAEYKSVSQYVAQKKKVVGIGGNFACFQENDAIKVLRVL